MESFLFTQSPSDSFSPVRPWEAAVSPGYAKLFCFASPPPLEILLSAAGELHSLDQVEGLKVPHPGSFTVYFVRFLENFSFSHTQPCRRREDKS